MTDNDATQTRQDDAAKQLRAMLDERGVEWRKWNYFGIDIGTIFSASGIEWIALWNPETNKLSITNYKIDLTPEQAIAATLGAGTCTLINAADDLGSGTSSCMCSECGYTALDDWWEEFNFCPNCGRKVVEE